MYPALHLMTIHPSIRIIIMAGMGLAALYMMHLLAQDFNRIRRPIAKVVQGLISKRDLDAVTQRDKVMFDNAEVNWNRVLQNDPLNCALSLICQISAGAEHKNKESKNINAFVQFSIRTDNAPYKIQNAYNMGTATHGKHEGCYKHYPHCPYSAKTMLKILDMHAYLFGNGKSKRR